jgi:hypothetical protein
MDNRRDVFMLFVYDRVSFWLGKISMSLEKYYAYVNIIIIFYL